jgi:hypothetical protein
MKNLKYWLAAAFIGQASYGFAQYEVDALRFSQTQPSGTARSLGIGGATVAVGADLGNLVTNPAGLGLYQRSEFSFTPGLGLGSTESRAFGSTATDSRNSLHVASLGAAFVNRQPDSDTRPWRGGTFAVGLNRINDYNQSFRYQGTASKDQHLLKRLGEDRGTDLDELAYEAYVTERDNAGTYVPADYSQSQAGPLNQGETVLTTGSQTQFDIGYGASYRDRLYLGGAIGIISTRFNSTSTLTATDPAPPAPNTPGTAFGSLTYREVLETRGTGINARIGAIYRASDALRLGVSVQTPTYMRLSESYSASMNVTYDSPIQPPNTQPVTSASVATDPGEFDYVLTSPFRASGGVAVVIGKHGFLSGDLEYVNYGQARLSNDNNSEVGSVNYDFGGNNDAIRNLYQSAVNLRLGGELRFDIFRLRAGYARYGDPYKQNDFDRTQNYFTAGAGMRQKNFFLDIAGVYGTNKRFYSPYTLSDASATPVVNVDGNRYTTTLTAGFLF